MNILKRDFVSTISNSILANCYNNNNNNFIAVVFSRFSLIRNNNAIYYLLLERVVKV